MKINKNMKILIIGLGLIGGSYASILSKKGYEVGAITLNKDDIDYAINNNIIKHGQVKVSKKYISKFDVVIFALYPKTFVEFIKKYHSYFKQNAIISDVSGVKESIVYQIQDMLSGDNVEFIACHPMAGKEVSGVKNASVDMFKNANFIITPTNKNTNEAIEFASSLAHELEFLNISTLSVEKHDEMIAFLSQLTHCIAISLMTCNDSTHLKDYTGDSFRDLTRIANINENMWSELFLLNKDKLIEQMELFEKQFELLKNYIKTEDVENMKEMMKLSTYRRSHFNKK